MNSTSTRRSYFLLCALSSASAFAQATPGGAAPAPPPAPLPSGAQPPSAAEAAPAKPAQTITPKKKPSCLEARRSGRYNIYFDKVELEKLVQTVSDVTCKTFIVPENIRGKISVIGPENGKVEVNADQFYAAFLAALDSNNLAAYEQGRFIKIIEKPKAKQSPIPTIGEEERIPTTNEQMVTKIFRLSNVELEPVRAVLQQLVSPSGDTIIYPPDILIVNDLASNLLRLEKVLQKLDTKLPSDSMRVFQIQFAPVTEITERLQKIFEIRNAKPGQRPPPLSLPDSENPQSGASLTQMIPDERTNRLVVIANPAGLSRVESLLGQLDIPVVGEGRINVVPLENASATEVVTTLQSLIQAASSRTTRPTGGAPRPTGASADLFSGDIKISADKPTNSLVIVANQSDLTNLQRVIDKLDVRRRQVFIEAVIMEVNTSRTSNIGVNFHGGVPAKDGQGNTLTNFFGTRYSGTGLPPSASLTNSLTSLGGFLAGIQGPNMTLNVGGTNIQIPSFGVIINALQTSSDVNVLSTPHILTTDNEDAEIIVGQNVPFQSGYTTALSTLGTNALGGQPYGTIQRQNVELKLSIKPQLNSADYVKLVINESIEEIASTDAILGPTTSKRSAKTTVIAKDQETVVIGGIMQDRVIKTVSKIPFLGDIPIIGRLFRTTDSRKVKVNLLLFLTPYVIRDASDFRRIFERKMKERQSFIEQFYGASTAYDAAIDYSRKPGPLARIAQVLNREANRVEFGGTGFGTNEKLVAPSTPGALELPASTRRASPTPAAATPPAATPAPAPPAAPPAANPPAVVAPPAAPPPPAATPQTAPPPTGTAPPPPTGTAPAPPTGTPPGTPPNPNDPANELQRSQ